MAKSNIKYKGNTAKSLMTLCKIAQLKCACQLPLTQEVHVNAGLLNFAIVTKISQLQERVLDCPNSTYLYLGFHLCSMTKLKEHSREIC